ncbi:Acylphosphatase-1-like protein, partial [Dinothrombium tinctorium]
YTKERSEKLGLKGWCMNTRQGTVVGTIQGEASQIDEMKHWLSEIGSPHSRIEKCVFKNEKEISKLEFGDFSIRQ